MGNSLKKDRVIRVRPKCPETFFMEGRILEEVGHGKARKYRRPNCSDTITSIHILTALIGNLNSPYRKLSRAGLLLWILSIVVNFMYDGYESRAKYGYPWMCVRGLLWVTCCVCTWFTARRTVPWLEKGLTKLESDRRYRKALRDMASTTKVRIFGTTLACVAGRRREGKGSKGAREYRWKEEGTYPHGLRVLVFSPFPPLRTPATQASTTHSFVNCAETPALALQKIRLTLKGYFD